VKQLRSGKTRQTIEFPTEMYDAIQAAKPDDRGYRLLDFSKRVRWICEDWLSQQGITVPPPTGRKRGRPPKNAQETSGAAQDGEGSLTPS
jgi:hypothetical protein